MMLLDIYMKAISPLFLPLSLPLSGEQQSSMKENLPSNVCVKGVDVSVSDEGCPLVRPFT